MAELEIASFEQIAVILSQLMTNYNAIIDNYYNMFYSTTPADITITLYDSTGTLTKYTIPNRAKDFNYIRNGEGSPEDNVAAPIGTMYQDTKNGVLYLKTIGTGSTGWREIVFDRNIEEGYGSPEGVLSRAKGNLYIDLDTAYLYIKATPVGNTGWSLINVDSSQTADRNLSNLTYTGENHFANPSLSNLNSGGLAVLNERANKNLSNLSASGENHFANLSLSNLNSAGQAVLNNGANKDLSNLSTTGENHFANLGLSNLNAAGQQVINNKANTDLSNTSSTGKNVSVNWGLPDFSNGIVVLDFSSSPGTSGSYSAPVTGWIYFEIYGGQLGFIGPIKINGIDVGSSYTVQNGDYRNNFGYYVESGDVVSWTNYDAAGVINVRFYPLKGAS